MGPDDEAMRRYLQWVQKSRHDTQTLESGNEFVPAAGEVTLRESQDVIAADHLLQPYLDLWAKLLDEGMTQAGIRMPEPYYVGILPGPDFNAWTAATSEGALLLISTQLSQVLYGAASVLVHMIDLGDKGKLMYSDEQVRAAWERLLRAYGVNRDAREMMWFAPQGGVRGQFQEVLSNLAHAFAISHEMGHVSRGHHRLSAAQQAGLTGEQEADRFAIEVLTHLDGARTDSRASHTIAASVALFFGTAEAVGVAHAVFRNGTAPLAASHPTPELRWESCSSHLSTLLPDVDLEFPSQLLARIRAMTGDARALWSSEFDL